MNKYIEGDVSPEVAFFLKGLNDVPERIAVGEKYNGTDSEIEEQKQLQDNSLRSIVLPFLNSMFSNPNNEINKKAVMYLQSMLPDIQGGTMLFSFESHPEKIEEVLSFFDANEVKIPEGLNDIRSYFTF